MEQKEKLRLGTLFYAGCFEQDNRFQAVSDELSRAGFYTNELLLFVSILRSEHVLVLPLFCPHFFEIVESSSGPTPQVC